MLILTEIALFRSGIEVTSSFEESLHGGHWI